MLNVREYHRPDRLETALGLLLRPDVHTVALAGGTSLVGEGAPGVEAVVDLQSLGLSYIRADAGSLHLGAMARLQELVDSPLVKAVAGGLVVKTARSSATSVLRHQATLGGTLIAAAGSADLVPVLIALDAIAVVRMPDERRVPLDRFCRDPRAGLAGGLLVEVEVPPLPRSGVAYHKVGRTPADQPIAGVAARLVIRDGLCESARLAVCGIGPAPVRLMDAEAALEGRTIDDATITAAAEAARAAVAPMDDFRAGADYRREMVAVLAARTVRNAWQTID